MYTALIVDDEEELRQAVIEGVDWESVGFRVVGDAANGVDALELVEKLEPDLILTDIRMPMMTGLELAKNVRELRPATQIVILSGYDDFRYAQTAIQYNIIGYLLKPISADELTKELGKIKSRMDEYFDRVQSREGDEQSKRRLEISEFLLPLLLGSGEDTPGDELLLGRAVSLGICEKTDSHSFAVMALKFKRQGVTCTGSEHIDFVNNILRGYLRSESFLVNGRIITLAASDKNLSEELRLPSRELVQSAARILGQTCTIGISRPFEKLSGSSGAYFEAITARRYTADGNGAVRFITDSERDSAGEFENVEKSVYKLEQLLKVGTDEELSSFISNLCEENKHGMNYLVIQILATVYRTMSSANDSEALSELIKSNPVCNRAALYDSEPNVKNDIEKLCLNAKSILLQSRKETSELLCDRVMEIIDNEYSNESLSLTDISARLYVSPNYLSSLIKKYRHENFTTLLSDRRMKAADDMLTCTQMKILEIASRCGYSDQHYFSYCFKKYFGVSPARRRAMVSTDQK